MTYHPSPSFDDVSTVVRDLTPGRRYVIRLYATSLTVGNDSFPALISVETPAQQPLRYDNY